MAAKVERQELGESLLNLWLGLEVLELVAKAATKQELELLLGPKIGKSSVLVEHD